MYHTDAECDRPKSPFTFQNNRYEKNRRILSFQWYMTATHSPQKNICNFKNITLHLSYQLESWNCDRYYNHVKIADKVFAVTPKEFPWLHASGTLLLWRIVLFLFWTENSWCLLKSYKCKTVVHLYLAWKTVLYFVLVVGDASY